MARTPSIAHSMLAPSSCISLSARSEHDHRQEASRVFWFCMRQLQLDGDVLSSEFYPDWQHQQRAWPEFVQQVELLALINARFLRPPLCAFVERPHIAHLPAIRYCATTATSPRIWSLYSEPASLSQLIASSACRLLRPINARPMQTAPTAVWFRWPRLRAMQSCAPPSAQLSLAQR